MLGTDLKSCVYVWNTPIITDNILRNHTFNAYGATGNVTGELVYANYGVCVTCVCVCVRMCVCVYVCVCGLSDAVKCSGLDFEKSSVSFRHARHIFSHSPFPLYVQLVEDFDKLYVRYLRSIAGNVWLLLL